VTYKSYIDYLRKCSDFISGEEDELLWLKNPSGGHEPRLKYKYLAIKDFDRPSCLWSKVIWKYKSLPKDEKMMWLLLNNIYLT